MHTDSGALVSVPDIVLDPAGSSDCTIDHRQSGCVVGQFIYDYGCAADNGRQDSRDIARGLHYSSAHAVFGHNELIYVYPDDIRRDTKRLTELVLSEWREILANVDPRS